MKRYEMETRKRVRIGKGGARSVRRDDLVPAIVYGGEQEPLPVSVDRHSMELMLRGGETENVLINLKLEGNDILTLVRDVQHHPVNGGIEHLDFLRVSEDKPIRTSVPLHSIGTSQGERNGGVFELVLREVEIECLPLDIPDFIEFDITNLDLGQSLHISDLPENPKVTILSDPENSIATVSAPSSMEAPSSGGDAEGEGEEEDAKAE